MPADPARIPMMTNDGIVLSRVDVGVRQTYRNAEDEGTTEREYFFDSAADMAVLVDEYWNWRRSPHRPHEGVEVDSGFGLGTTLPLAPAVPQMNTYDESRDINAALKVRAFAVDYGAERYSVELLG